MTNRVDKHNRGYVPMHQTHYPGNKPDLKESFKRRHGADARRSEVKAKSRCTASTAGRNSMAFARRSKPISMP